MPGELVLVMLQMMQDPGAGMVESANGLVVIVSGLLGALTFVAPRRRALVPLVLTACFVPVGGKIDIAGLNFSALRIVTACGCARVLLRGEGRQLHLNRFDLIVLVAALYRVLTFVLLWQTPHSLVNALGYAFDSVALYIFFRAMLRDDSDVKGVLTAFAAALPLTAALMCVERYTGRNPFNVFGGVSDLAWVFQGRVRCQGPFAHAILAGTFGAVLVPLFVGLWWKSPGKRAIATAGILSCTALTVLSGSSGPLGTYIAGIVGLLMWSIRYHMRAVRWFIVISILGLQLIMHDPVWFIFARVNLLSGSTGWHRAYLIDATVRNFGQWWLLGAKDVASWGVFAGDTTNQYVVEAVRSGIGGLILFIWISVAAFKSLGVSKKQARRDNRFRWAVGVALTAHLVSFMGVSYFDQNIVNWYLVLALIPVVNISRQSRELQEDASRSRRRPAPTVEAV